MKKLQEEEDKKKKEIKKKKKKRVKKLKSKFNFKKSTLPKEWQEKEPEKQEKVEEDVEEEIEEEIEEMPLTGNKCPKGYKKNKKTGMCKKTQRKLKKTCDKLIDDLQGVVDKLTMEEEKYNEILKCISDRNRSNISEEIDYLYPLLDDQKFNTKIAHKKEFYDAKYNHRPDSDYENIEEVTNKLCDANRDFELSPHQKFVRNFLSFKTPYNSLLLYHGLGSGKTCSAISVCEEMRLYSKQLKNPKRIIIVASPNVQTNFKLQLFDERKLKQIDGTWNIKSCTGNTFIKEINPMNMRGISRIRVIRQVKRIINNSYLFMGYVQFANWISSKMEQHGRADLGSKERRRRSLKRIKNEFSNRMIVIDEVQNIRSQEGVLKTTTENLINLVKYTDDMKLLLLSATPMFNNPREIVWLLNLMNINDERYGIKEREIFDSDDNLKMKNGNEVGKELLIRKSTGYISYIRGENPFTFPFRLFPDNFNNPNSLKKILRDDANWYPEKQINLRPITEPINILDLYITRLGVYQEKSYEFGLKMMRKKHKILNKGTGKGLQYTILDPLTQLLNISYPLLEEEVTWNMSTFKKKMYGKGGLKNCMYQKVPKSGIKRRKFRYKENILEKYGRIFSEEELPKYSGKISKICNIIKNSKGIVLVYSQFIDGGCVPLALGLEEMGFKRYGDKYNSLFENNDVEPLNALTMQPRGEEEDFKQASYIMITGSDEFSPDNDLELIACTNENNTNGEIVKVVIVSKAGSEGLDFKNIRQVHILEPWYNFNRIEQTIGRAVRNLSHCRLPFNERNVEIYLYGSELDDNSIEAVDLYMYRLSEQKAKKIGSISKILKENAIDCLLNKPYNVIDKDINVNLTTSSDVNIEFNIKDKPKTSLCDFMDMCECNCIPQNIEIDEEAIRMDTYDESFIIMNLDKIINKINQLFKEKYVYHKTELIAGINAAKFYPKEQIYMALSRLIDEENEFVTDILGRVGKVVVIGDYYMFQPIEIKNSNISLFERSVPVDYKRKHLEFSLPENIIETKYEEKKEEDDDYGELEETKSRRKDNDILIRLYDELDEKLKIISKTYPEEINIKNRKDWVYNCSWVIWNLSTYNNEFDRTILIQLAFNHFIDLLSYEEKLILANTIYFKNGRLNRLEIALKNYFDDYIIENNSLKYLVIFNKNDTSKNKFKHCILTKKNKWEFDIRSLGNTQSLLALKHMFVSGNKNSYDIGILNDKVGFMIFDKRYNMVFKNKSLILDSGRRIKKGVSCERGHKKGKLIEQINNLMEMKSSMKKYTMDIKLGKKKEDIVKMYNYEGEDIVFYLRDKEGNKIRSKKPVIISTLQLCIELELIYRYYDKIRKNGKKWFLSELESNLNKIETVGI